MPLPFGGLVKLSEECAEVIQIAQKKINYWTTDAHPDGKGSMKERLEDEIGDVMGALCFVVQKLGLNEERIEARAERKIARFKLWDSTEDPGTRCINHEWYERRCRHCGIDVEQAIGNADLDDGV